MSDPNDPQPDSAFEEIGQPKVDSNSEQPLLGDRIDDATSGEQTNFDSASQTSLDDSQASTATDQLDGEDKAKHTALQCLALLARHHGVDVSADRLIHDYSLANETPSLRKILRICKDSGIKARHARMNWKQLKKIGEGFPVMARLLNPLGKAKRSLPKKRTACLTRTSPSA